MCCFNIYITAEIFKFLFFFLLIDTSDLFVDDNGNTESDDQQKICQDGKIFRSNSKNILKKRYDKYFYF